MSREQRRKNSQRQVEGALLDALSDLGNSELEARLAQKQAAYDSCIGNNPCKRGRWVNAGSPEEMYFKT